MAEVIGRFSAQTFALLRIVSGLMFAMHGSQKLLGWPPMPPEMGGPLPPLMKVAGGIELVGGLLIAIGLLDRKSTRLNSSHEWISYAVFCLKKKEEDTSF